MSITIDPQPPPGDSGPPTEARDRSDMEKLQAGHDAALNDLMERHAAPIFHFLCRMTGNEDDANDLAQETFVRVYKAKASYHPGQKFSTWLYTIAANLARNHFRWQKRHPVISIESGPPNTEKSLADTLATNAPAPNTAALTSERNLAVRAAVNNLAPDLREAITLCEWEEKSVSEAANILATTPKSVESRLYRARQILRKQLKGWLD